MSDSGGGTPQDADVPPAEERGTETSLTEQRESPGVLFGVPPSIRRISTPDAGAARLVLVRHGEANCNVNGIVGGVRGCSGLTDLGRRQVTALASRLRQSGELAGASFLYASTLPRAIETALLLQPVVGNGELEIVRQRDLSELLPGEADGLAWQEVVDRFGLPAWDTDPDVVIAPGGESWSGFVRRASGAVAELAHHHRGQLVVAAVHAGVIEATALAFLQIPAAASRRGWSRIVHASLTEWEWVPTESVGCSSDSTMPAGFPPSNEGPALGVSQP